MLRDAAFKRSHCLAIHALCSKRTAQAISGNSASFHTTNTIPNALAKFDVAPLIAEALIASAEMS